MASRDAGGSSREVGEVANVFVGGFDEGPKRLGIDVFAGAELDVAHSLAGALEEVRRVGKDRTGEEADVDVLREGTDVGERQILYAGDGPAIVHEFHDIRATLAHVLEPRSGDGAQGIVAFREPRFDGRVARHGTVQSKPLFHESRLVQGHALVGDAGFHEGSAFGAEARLAIELDCVGLGFEEYLRVVALAGGLYGSV